MLLMNGKCVTLSDRIVYFYCHLGETVQASLEKSLLYMKEKTGTKIGGAIIIDKNGNCGQDFISPEMSWASLKANEFRWGFVHGQEEVETLSA